MKKPNKPSKLYLTFATLMFGLFFTILLHEPVLNSNPTTVEQVLNWAGCGMAGFCAGFVGAIIFYYLFTLYLSLLVFVCHLAFDRLR